MIGIGEPPSAENSGTEINNIPAAALAIDGTNPEEGDAVEFTVKGKVSGVNGDKITVTPETINGEPVGKPEEKPENMSDDDMMKAALQADKEGQ